MPLKRFKAGVLVEVKIQVKIPRNRSAFTVSSKHIDCCVGNWVYSANKGGDEYLKKQA